MDWQRSLILVTNTKTGADRTVPMNETVRELLTGRWRAADKSKARVFDAEAGRVSDAFRRLSRSAKLIDFNFHDLQRRLC